MFVCMYVDSVHESYESMCVCVCVDGLLNEFSEYCGCKKKLL